MKLIIAYLKFNIFKIYFILFFFLFFLTRKVVIENIKVHIQNPKWKRKDLNYGYKKLFFYTIIHPKVDSSFVDRKAGL